MIETAVIERNYDWTFVKGHTDNGIVGGGKRDTRSKRVLTRGARSKCVGRL